MSSNPRPSRVLLEHESCYQCCFAMIRHAGASLNRGTITKRPVVECALRGHNRTCDTCLTGYKPCEKVATLLEGDYFDMFALLRWADQVASQPNQVLVGNMQFWWSLWTDIQKRGMLQMELDLMKTFRQVESNYRAEHGLNVGKVQREGNGATATYDGLISDGRAGLGQLHPAAASNFFFPQSAYDVELWNNKLRLRLEYGDRNFLAWAQAKRSFVEKILEMAKAKGAEHGAFSSVACPLPPSCSLREWAGSAAMTDSGTPSAGPCAWSGCSTSPCLSSHGV